MPSHRPNQPHRRKTFTERFHGRFGAKPSRRVQKPNGNAIVKGVGIVLLLALGLLIAVGVAVIAAFGLSVLGMVVAVFAIGLVLAMINKIVPDNLFIIALAFFLKILSTGPGCFITLLAITARGLFGILASCPRILLFFGIILLICPIFHFMDVHHIEGGVFSGICLFFFAFFVGCVYNSVENFWND